MSIVEAARAIGIKPRTVREWIRRGKIGAIKVNRKWAIPEEEVSRIIKERRGK